MLNKRHWFSWCAEHPVGVFAAGALLALGFAPFQLWPVLFITIPVLYTALSRVGSLRQSAWRGFLFGYGFSIAGTYWIANSLLVDAEQFAWLIPFSVLGLSAVMALWWALLGAVYHKFRSEYATLDVALFMIVFLWIELAKSYGMFGFPWNLMGYVFADQLMVIQFASIAGVYGLSALALLAGLLPLMWFRSRRVFAAGMCAVLVVLAWGAYRLEQPVSFSDTAVRLVQPNIEQTQKWQPELAQQIMDSLRHLSTAPATQQNKRPDIVIWPETALPFTIKHPSGWRRVSDYAVPKNSWLITGMVRRAPDGSGPYNSMVFVKDGTLQAVYDKYQLVPFGEFVPFQDYLPLDKITNGAQNFQSGEISQTVALGDAFFIRPLICYEAIFPDLPFIDQPEPARMLLNITNDAWFGNSPGPYQHAAMARMRAVESGLPLIRVANTGISQVIGPYGRIYAQLALGERGYIDHQVPQVSHLPWFSTKKFIAWLLLFTGIFIIVRFNLRVKLINNG